MTHNPPLELTNPNIAVSKINASVIWLHGLGADGYDFEPIAQQLLQPQYLPNVRFILPHAPDMAVTRNNGYVMPAWYDIYGIIPVSREDEAGIQASQHTINALIQTEIDRGIASERIVLAGFSQGGAVALHTALRYPQRLGGILALSTYLPLHDKLALEANAANANTPIFMAHGIFDDVISLEMSQISRNLLQNRRYLVTWHEYKMAHSVCVDEIADIARFLQQVLA
ncbi:MAG: alpha/beta hydrolase-fold protein [Methylotenera sp.]|nr:alpha/beta hydrolase-fold protein [Methylotenera sp.]